MLNLEQVSGLSLSSWMLRKWNTEARNILRRMIFSSHFKFPFLFLLAGNEILREAVQRLCHIFAAVGDRVVS